MCGGIEARDAEKSYKVYFPSLKAAIPVLGAGGEGLGWVRWGDARMSPAQAHKVAGRSWKRSSVAAGGNTTLNAYWVSSSGTCRKMPSAPRTGSM
tara:strand:- start:100 stop:384 length:285 start_codon:yes stop_codon:yes gene_type:complete